jgi:HK97 family phage major capsid protein
MSGEDQGTGTLDQPDERDAAGQRRGPTLTHSQAINRLHDLRTQMGAIAELDNPSAEDDKYFSELEIEFQDVDAHRRRLERDAALAAVRQTTDGLSAVGYLRSERGAFDNQRNGRGHDGSHGYDRDAIMEPDSITDARFRNPWAFDEVRTFGRDPDAVAREWHSRALSACERMPAATDAIRKASTDIIERWDDEDGNLARFMLAGSQPAYLRAWCKIFKAGDRVANLSVEERQAVATVQHISRQTRAMSLTDSAGGYLVPFQLDPTIVLTANGSVNEIRQAARTVVAIGDTWNGISSGAVAWSYDAEAAQVSDDSTTFAQPTIPIYKAQGFVPISIEAIQDAANVTAEVAMLMAAGKDILEAQAFAVGSGVAMPTGIVPSLTGGASEVTTASDTALAIGDIYKLHGSLPARYRRNASWLANNLIYNMIRAFGTTYELWGALAGDRPTTLLNRPAYESEDMDGTIAAGTDYVMVFGDFNNYVIADRIGMTMEFVPHLFQQTTAGTGFGRPTGQRGWLAYVRHGADSVNDAAFRMLKA